MSPNITHLACKLPHGLNIEGVRINGVAYDRGGPAPELFGGYALTFNVPVDIWETWRAANIRSPVVVNQLVFADQSLGTLKAKARSLASTRSGLEAR